MRQRWPLVLLLLWSAGLGLIIALTPRGQPLPATCLFRATTGLPCPTCGSTRAMLALARLDLLEALRLNPLIASLMILAPALIVVASRARPNVSPSLAAAVILAGVALNWVYLLVTRAAG